MKTLILVRHGHAADETGSDHARALTERGRLAVKATADALTRYPIDHVLSSSAVRARQTAELLVQCLGLAAPPELDADLYGASPAAFLRRVGTLGGGCKCVLVVGHNPTISEVATTLSGTAYGFSPAAFAVVQRDVATWPEFVE